VPVASAAAKGVTYNAGSLNASLALTDWWFLYGSGARYWFSDDNTRDHLALGTRFLVYEPPGLHLGALYTYDSADEEKPDYWTPYELSSFYLEALLRRTYRRTYYNVGLRYGIGRENLRPEARLRHEAAVNQMKRDLDTARRNQWSRESIANLERWLDDLMDNPPEDPDWHRVLSAVASFRTRLGKHWELNGEVSYNRKPDYKYLAFLGGVKYTF